MRKILKVTWTVEEHAGRFFAQEATSGGGDYQNGAALIGPFESAAAAEDIIRMRHFNMLSLFQNERQAIEAAKVEIAKAAKEAA